MTDLTPIDQTSDNVIQARPVQIHFPPPPPRRHVSPMELSTVSRRDAVLDLGLVLLVTLLLPFGLNFIALLLMEPPAFEGNLTYLEALGKWSDALLVGGLLAYLLLRHRLPPTSFGLHLRRPHIQGLWALGSLVCTYGWLLLSLVGILSIIVVYPPLEEDIMQRSKVLEAMPTENLGLTVLLLIPVAIHEEILFRALLLPYLRRLCGNWTVAILLS